MRAQALVSIVGFGGLGEKVSRFLSKAPSKTEDVLLPYNVGALIVRIGFGGFLIVQVIMIVPPQTLFQNSFNKENETKKAKRVMGSAVSSRVFGCTGFRVQGLGLTMAWVGGGGGGRGGRA